MKPGAWLVNQITCLLSGKILVKSSYVVRSLWAAFSLRRKHHLSICPTWSGIFGLHMGILYVRGFCCISFSSHFLIQNTGKRKVCMERHHVVGTSKLGPVCEMRMLNLGWSALEMLGNGNVQVCHVTVLSCSQAVNLSEVQKLLEVVIVTNPSDSIYSFLDTINSSEVFIIYLQLMTQLKRLNNHLTVVICSLISG